LICGASGSGKSTLLRAIEAKLRATKKPGQLQRLTDIPLTPDRAVVDCFSQPLAETLALLSRAGLSEARVWLRKPAELSEGEQFRYRLARWMASSAQVLLADEFCAPLDRITARVVAWQLGKFVRASRRCAIVATSHEDLLADLQPTRVIRKRRAFNTKTRRHQEHQGGDVNSEI